MRLLLFSFLLMITGTISAQKKKVYYQDENGNNIDSQAYSKDKNDPAYFHLKFDLDSARVFVKVTRKHSGTMNLDSLNLIKKDLEKVSNASIDPAHIIVIDYYPGKDKCNSSGTTDTELIQNEQNDYLKKLHRLAPVSQFFIYNEKEGLERFGGTERWKADAQHRIKNAFFKWHYPCGSVVVIHPDGRYISYYGEYSTAQVLDYVKELNKK